MVQVRAPNIDILWSTRNVLGRVVFAYDPKDEFLHRRVLLVPLRGWHSDPKGPEAKFSVLGGVPEGGTFSEFVVVHRSQIIPIPNHIPMVHAAAWPVGGLTAWRAVAIKANVKEGENVLITGIGGGVAIIALQLCVAKGANVYVTSSNAEKIAYAKSIGAIDGVNYKDVDWPEKLSKILSANAKNGRPPLLDAVIDSAGGDICATTNKIIRAGGIIVCYGMTVVPKIEFSMREVLKNIELKGSTMGSRQDFIDATAFLAEKRIVPEVSRVLRGLEEASEGFRFLEEGNQMGKIVIKFPGREPGGEVRGSLGLGDSHVPNRM